MRYLNRRRVRAARRVVWVILFGEDRSYTIRFDGARWSRQRGAAPADVTVQTSPPEWVKFLSAEAGVLAMTKSLAVEWGPRGIRTCAIVSGLFPTEGAWSRLMPKERGGDEELVKTIPLRRVGEHIELANLAAFLVSDGAAYINGDAVVIDGGTMQSGGGGASTQSMLDWTDEQWEAIRPKKK